MERTLIILKPDAVEKGLEELIRMEIGFLELRVARRRKMRLDAAIVTEHYRHHAEKPFFPGLCAYMTRGPVVAIVVEGDKAVSKMRAWTGATDPAKALPATLRGRFGKNMPDGSVENVLHASENPEEAKVEIRRFFGKERAWTRLWRYLFS